MARDVGQEPKLRVDRGEMLEHAKRRDDQREGRPQGEVVHVALMQRGTLLHVGRFTRKILATALEHLVRAVETDDRVPRARDR